MPKEFITIFLLVFCNTNNASTFSRSTMKKEFSSCYSDDNFGIFYEYVSDRIKTGNKKFCIYESYQLYITSPSSIALKKDNYTTAFIEKGMGIYSLAKVLESNRKLTKEADRLFCKIVGLLGEMD